MFLKALLSNYFCTDRSDNWFSRESETRQEFVANGARFSNKFIQRGMSVETEEGTSDFSL